MMAKSDIIMHPFVSEKTSAKVELENTLVFVVRKHATKTTIKQAIEKIYNMKVVGVNTTIGPDGNKRAYVKFSDDTPAIDLATRLGVL